MDKIDRRDFVKGTTAAAALGCATRNAGAEVEAPNVVLITADDLGWKELGCMGNTDISTPNIDRLAAGGVRFTNAFVTAPSCSASRASIITGKAPHTVHVLGLTHRHPRYQMSPQVPTMPAALKDTGYNTAIQGKWHVSTYKDTRKFGYQKRLSILRIKDSDQARRFISKNRGRRFYLELNYIQPHRLADGTFKMDPDFPVDPESIKVPDYWQIPDWPDVREDAARYYSQAARMDHLIGEVMDHLESEGLADNTLVIFVSDNGVPYPGCKTTCYDRGIGTPMIMRWPREIPAGAVSDALVSTVDIMPTVLDAAGAPCPPVQGASLLPLAREEKKKVHDEVFAEVTYHVIYTPMRAIRTKDYKYIENLSPDPTGLDQNRNFEWAKKAAQEPGQRCCVLRPPEELYHLAADPDEKINLADDPARARVKNEMRERLHRWREETADPFPNLE